MTDVKAEIEYKLNLNDKSVVLSEKMFLLLENINLTGSITGGAKKTHIAYRTALNYIDKIESSLNIKIINTRKGGKGGGGCAVLKDEGKSILKECKKINAIVELHRNVNEIPSKVIAINNDNKTLTLEFTGENSNIGSNSSNSPNSSNDNNIDTEKIEIIIPHNDKYKIGDNVIGLISYDNIFLMMNCEETSVRNILNGEITELSLLNDILRVKVNINGLNLFIDITKSSGDKLDLKIGKKIYIAFKAASIATLKA
ncbi:MAG: TOBE domain-containing protein [Methanobacteriaceae archaeon]